MARRKYLCGVPWEECTGSIVKMQNMWASGAASARRGTARVHDSREEAFVCHRNHLLRQGFVQIGPRDFQAPNNGPVRVLTKKSTFGAELRWGKERSRWMTDHPYHVVINC